jgi:hypothetical protein
MRWILIFLIPLLISSWNVPLLSVSGTKKGYWSYRSKGKDLCMFLAVYIWLFLFLVAVCLAVIIYM